METDPKGVRIAPTTIERILRERSNAQKRGLSLEQSIRDALSELGVPHEATPAPVVNAHRILREALGD